MRLCTADEIRLLEADAAERGVTPEILMDSAAEALWDALVHDTPALPENLVILCGPGNNGADGYTLAALCRERGMKASVIAVTEPKSALCRTRAFASSTLSSPLFSFEGNEEVLCASLLQNADCIVDCVFGVGYDAAREPDERFVSLCRLMQSSSAFVIAADVPSGLDADSGLFAGKGELPLLIPADETVTFTASKPALETAPGNLAAGQVRVADVGIPKELTDSFKTRFELTDRSVLRLLPKREPESSKANYGKLFSYCGSPDMPGAAVLAASGALRSGVGLLTCFGQESVLKQIAFRFPEPVYLPLPTDFEGDTDLPAARTRIAERLQSATAVLVGCGIGTSKEPEALLEAILLTAVCPVICDADALTILARRKDLLETYGEKLILTPHPGEMGRLTGKTPAEVQTARIATATAFSEEYGSVVVLKGNRTVIASPDGRVSVNPTGNPGMAKAGMGDLLAGILASLAAQEGLTPYDAARLAVFLHGRAGDLAAAQKGEISMLTSDVADLLSDAFRE